jgi:hypothetical protein
MTRILAIAGLCCLLIVCLAGCGHLSPEDRMAIQAGLSHFGDGLHDASASMQQAAQAHRDAAASIQRGINRLACMPVGQLSSPADCDED